jgi:ankyrin repeat protein
VAFINTVLNTEIAKGDFQAVKHLIENQGYSPNYTGLFGLAHTPLYIAATSKQVEILDYLIQKGADVNKRGRWWLDSRPLDMALEIQHVPMVASLLARNAQIPIPNEKFFSDSSKNYMKTKIVTEYLIKATSSNDTASIEKILKNQHADINKYNLDDNYKQLPTALATAVKENHFEATSLLLEKGATVNTIYSFNWTNHPLNLVQNNQIAELLIKHTPKINDSLVELIMLDKPQLVTLLIKNGALINTTYFDGEYDFMTPLEAAVIQDDSAMIKMLVSYGADLKAESTSIYYLHSTPLEFAALNGYLQALETLIELGADLNHKNSFSHKTALELAYAFDEIPAMNKLILHNAEVPEYIHAKLDLLKPIETNQVLTGDQIITLVGQDSQSINDSHHSTISDNNQPEIYVQPLVATLSSLEHHEQLFLG